jgi:hypothetical protein
MNAEDVFLGGRFRRPQLRTGQGPFGLQTLFDESVFFHRENVSPDIYLVQGTPDDGNPTAFTHDPPFLSTAVLASVTLFQRGQGR